jgi:hypothetical protein
MEKHRANLEKVAQQRESILRLAQVPNSVGMGSDLTAAQAAVKIAETSGWARACSLFFAK